MLVQGPVKKIKLLPIILNGYVSKKGHGISISYKTAEESRKLRIFSDGTAEELFRSYKNQNDVFGFRTRLLPTDTFKFNHLIKKYNEPGALSLFKINDILKEFANYTEKNGCRNTNLI
ncbi:MAG: hypothetical protein MJ180_02900 [Candidatus Gastranaerophilales bacterium]|nr:hypothetical protein [Candidatus Gastranaerophilales bacterium]